MASIERRSGKWRVRWRSLDGRNRSQTFTTGTAAKRHKKAVEAAAERGEEWTPRHTATDPDIGEVMQAFLNDRGRTLSRNSVVNYRSALEIFRRFLRSQQPRGRLRLDLMTKSALGAFFDWQVEVGNCRRGTAAKRVNIIQGRRGLWQWAANDDRYVGLIPPPRTIELPGESPETVLMIPITLAMADKAVLSSIGGAWYRQLFTILRYTGLRKMQALSLLWSDFDFEQGLMTVRPELGKTTAERRGRVVPVSPHLLEEIAGWGRREGRVIASPPAQRVHYRTARRRWFESGAIPAEIAATCERAQSCHWFRKALISGLVATGSDMDTAKALVGHSRGVTGDIYATAISIMPKLRAAVARIPRIGEAEAVDYFSRTPGVPKVTASKS